MPTYSYHCEMCDADFDEIRSIALRETAQCPCGRMASQILSIGRNLAIGCVLEPYYSDALGEIVKGPKHRKDLMKQKGLEEA